MGDQKRIPRVVITFFLFFPPSFSKAILRRAELPSLCNAVFFPIYQLFVPHFAMAVFSVLCVHININKQRDTSLEFSSILSTVDLSIHLIMVESFENSYSSSILWPSVSSFPFSAIEYGWTCVSGYFREYGWTCVRGYFGQMRLPSHVVSTFIMKTFVLDFIQCRNFLNVLYRVRNA